MICPGCAFPGYKTWDGADPKCAFDTGVFSSDNWNCCTMNQIRECCYDQLRVHEGYAYGDDQRGQIVMGHEAGFDGIFVLGWYKHRGRTEQFLFIPGALYDGSGAVPVAAEAVSLATAETLAAWLQRTREGVQRGH